MFLSFKTLLIFFNVNFFKNATKVSNGLDPDQARHVVVPDLDLNWLQK